MFCETYIPVLYLVGQKKTTCSRIFTKMTSAHHDVVVDESFAITCRFEVGILFGAGDPYVPHTPPGLIELHVHRVHT